MRNVLRVFVGLGLFAFTQMHAVAVGETVTNATVLFPDTEIKLESASGESIPVQVHAVRALKIRPAEGEKKVGVRACGATGCLPEHEVLLASAKDAVVKFDLEFTNRLTSTGDSKRDNAYFGSDKARFNVDGTLMAPILELEKPINGPASERQVSFYIVPQQKVLQTIFMRVPGESDSVTLLYGKDKNAPVASLQVCFSSCQGPVEAKNDDAATDSNFMATPVIESDCKMNGKSVPCDQVAEKVGAFAKMGLGVLIGTILFGLIATVFWVMMLIHVAKHPIEHKAVWIGGMFLFGIFVSIAYYFAVKRPLDKSQENPPLSSAPDHTSVEIPRSPFPPSLT